MSLIEKIFCHSLLVLILSLAVSCRKEKLTCKGNCVEVRFAGVLLDKAYNKPLSKLDVGVTLQQNRNCLLCTTYKVGGGRTGDDGRYSVSALLDSTLISDNHLTVSVRVPAGYILYPEPVGPGISNNRDYSSFSFYDLDVAQLAKVDFNFYPKTLLKINLRRTTPVSQQGYLGLDFSFDDKTSIWGLKESISNGDTSLTINTSANLFTKIRSTKYDALNNIIVRTDSVFCKADADNEIFITY